MRRLMQLPYLDGKNEATAHLNKKQQNKLETRKLENVKENPLLPTLCAELS